MRHLTIEWKGRFCREVPLCEWNGKKKRRILRTQRFDSRNRTGIDCRWCVDSAHLCAAQVLAGLVRAGSPAGGHCIESAVLI